MENQNSKENDAGRRRKLEAEEKVKEEEENN